MHTFFKEMIKYNLTLMIVIPNDDKQIALSNDAIPATEEEFTKFFTIDTKTCMTGNKSQVIMVATLQVTAHSEKSSLTLQV